MIEKLEMAMTSRADGAADVVDLIEVKEKVNDLVDEVLVLRQSLDEVLSVFTGLRGRVPTTDDGLRIMATKTLRRRKEAK